MRREEELEKIEDFVLASREFLVLGSKRAGAYLRVFALFAQFARCCLGGMSGKRKQSIAVPSNHLNITPTPASRE